MAMEESLLSKRNTGLQSLYFNTNKKKAKVAATTEDEFFVMSPNMDVLYKPPTQNVSVRLRKDSYFGVDDPLLYPQPLIHSVAHLSVIRFPSTPVGHPLAIMWHRLGDDDFFTTAKDKYSGFVRLQDKILGSYVSLVGELVNELEDYQRGASLLSQASSPKEDQLIQRYQSLVLDSIALIRLPSPRKRLVFFFVIAQRRYLEFRARFEWLTCYKPRLLKIGQNKEPFPTGDLVGAFVEDHAIMEDFFHAGIPVWLVLPASRSSEYKIDYQVAFHHPADDLPIRKSGLVATLADAEPPFPVIYDGKAAEHTRYQAMGSFLASYASYGAMGRPTENTSSLPSIANSNIIKHGEKKRSLGNPPYEKKKTKKAGERQEPRNKFCSIDSPYLPTPVPAWKKALELLSDSAPDQPQPRPGMHTGYWYPEAAMFVAPSNDRTKAAFLATWLNIREIMLYRVRCSELSGPLLAKQWKTILSLGFAKVGETQSTRRSSASHCLDILQHISQQYEPEIDLANLSNLPAEWRGFTLKTASPPPENDLVPAESNVLPPEVVVREILWEISELNFRQEFVSLDYALDTSFDFFSSQKPGALALHRLREDRIASINNHCWPGTTLDVDQNKISDSIASSSFRVRYDRIGSMSRIMSSWRGAPTTVVQGIRRWNESFPVTLELTLELDKLEAEIAKFYTTSFLEIFGRAASLPCSL